MIFSVDHFVDVLKILIILTFCFDFGGHTINACFWLCAQGVILVVFGALLTPDVDACWKASILPAVLLFHFVF